MMRFLLSIMLCFSATNIALASEFENNWHQWRGPYANGFAPNAQPPIEWSEENNIKWKVELPGESSATPIIWGDKLFVVAAKKTDKQVQSNGQSSESQENRGRGGRFGISTPTNYYQFIVMCLDKNTGEIIWQDIATEQVPHEGHHSTGSYAAGSPMTDGENLYVTFGSFGYFCYDLEGNKKWEIDLGDKKTRNSFGEGSSIVVHDDSMIVNWDNEVDSYIYCLDKTNSEVRWKKHRDEQTTWSTPLITEYNGVTQVIANGTTRARSYNLEDGELLWECGGQTTNPIPSPIRFKDMAICTSGFRGSAMYAIPLDAKGDISNTDKIAWTFNQDTPYVPSPLLYNDQLYFLKSRSAIITSINANDGSVVIDTTRLPARGEVYASPVGADGKVYICTREGETIVLEHGDKFKVLANNKLDEVFDASPIALGNYLYLRGKKYLYCIGS